MMIILSRTAQMDCAFDLPGRQIVEGQYMGLKLWSGTS